MSGVNDTSRAAFNPKIVLGLLAFGAIAFLAMLYLIGTGNTGGETNDGKAHASGKGLNGYAAFAGLLEEEGYEVSLSRSQGGLDDEGLLILTPPTYADASDIAAIIDDRRYVGPTMIILPKWDTRSISALSGQDIEEGWVRLSGVTKPNWTDDLDGDFAMEIAANDPAPEDLTSDQSSAPAPAKNVVKMSGKVVGSSWKGLGLTGKLPTQSNLSAEYSSLIPLVSGEAGQIYAGYVDDDGFYPDLAEAARVGGDDTDYLDRDKWPVTFVIEPDLVNNYGFADKNRALLALDLTKLAMERSDLPITFDQTLNGLGKSQNLLTLAFTPPFLAATLCLILALIVAAWRAFLRFGPPVAESRSIAFGKVRLVKNSAGFIQRSRRLHLLSQPYSEMIRHNIGKALGLRHVDDATIEAALSRRVADAPSFSQCVANLHDAKSPQNILRAAAALKSIERMLTK